MREFMDEDEPAGTEAEALPCVCCLLRTKTAFGHSVGYRPWQRGESSTAVYWCLKTMETVGPDDRFVHPGQCCSSRICYRSADE